MLDMPSFPRLTQPNEGGRRQQLPVPHLRPFHPQHAALVAPLRAVQLAHCVVAVLLIPAAQVVERMGKKRTT